MTRRRHDGARRGSLGLVRASYASFLARALGGGGGGASPDTFAHWRLRFTEADSFSGGALAEVEFRDAQGTRIPTVGSASAFSEEFGPAADAFDQDTSTFWAGSSGDITNGDAFLAFAFDTPTWVFSYAITARDGSSRQTPLGWVLEYSEDGLAWTEADVVSGEAAFFTPETRAYTNDTPQPTSGGAGGGPVSPHFLDPTRTPATYTLSNDDKTATDTGGNADRMKYQVGQGVITEPAYWEVYVRSLGTTRAAIGVLEESKIGSYDLSFYNGENLDQGGTRVVSGTGEIRRRGSFIASSSPEGFTGGDIIMVAYDPPTGAVWFGKNGVWTHDPATDPSILNPGSELDSRMALTLGQGGEMTLYSGDELVYPVPAGFNALRDYSGDTPPPVT